MIKEGIKIGGAVARAVLELGRNKEQLEPLNQSINIAKKTPSHKSSAKNVSGRRNVRARGSIAVVSRYWWSAQPDCDLQEMVCIRVGVRGFALKETQRGIAHYYIVYLKDKHTTIKCIKKEGYRKKIYKKMIQISIRVKESFFHATSFSPFQPLIFSLKHGKITLRKIEEWISFVTWCEEFSH